MELESELIPNANIVAVKVQIMFIIMLLVGTCVSFLVPAL